MGVNWRDGGGGVGEFKEGERLQKIRS
nr:hypothetical protein C09B9.5 - Caenorhabditis elegans [Caenorhabditis elegans]